MPTLEDAVAGGSAIAISCLGGSSSINVSLYTTCGCLGGSQGCDGLMKESNKQHQTSIYLTTYDTLTLIISSQTSNGKHIVSSHDNLQQQ